MALNYPKYDPVGFCIYCGADGCETPMTDEHIIPRMLEGPLILPKSSCTACAAKTGSVEQYIGRSLLWEYRLIEKVSSRRGSKGRPKSLPYKFRMKDGSVREGFSDLSNTPSTVYLPRFEMPKIYQSAFGKVDPFEPHYPIYLSSWTKRDTSHATNPSISKVFSTVWMDYAKFYKFLAKIAHSYAYAHIKRYPFEPLLNEIIVGDDKRYAYFIGSEYKRGGVLLCDHEIGVFIQNIGRDRFVTVRLRILCKLGYTSIDNIASMPHCGTPIYWVVVGRAL